MKKMNRRSILKASVTGIMVASLPRYAGAQTAFVPPSYTPEDLKGQLTPYGAIRAGNADGSIPAWTGSGYPVPAGFQPGDMRPIPFADEAPLFTITAATMSQYGDKVSDGLKGLFQKYADFTMQVFPTHRTASAPQWVYDNIYENATSAQTSPDGNSMTGAYGGIPFPLPKNGHEVIWNHLLPWLGVTAHFVTQAHFVDSTGQAVFESQTSAWAQYPFYIPGGKSQFVGIYLQDYAVPTAPPYQAGQSIMIDETVNQGIQPVEAWEYLVGQRRTRRAPELQYDTPNSLTGGIVNWDETFLFAGQMNEYDFTYTGIKEVFVPYNTNKAYAAAPEAQFLPHFLNPEITRWELHRCRVVEMTLKPGARNVDARRILYCDEDTGSAVLGEVYDANGALWKTLHAMPAIYGDVPCVQTQQFSMVYDLHAGNYCATDHYNSVTQPQWKIIPVLPASFFTPGHLSGAAGGF